MLEISNLLPYYDRDMDQTDNEDLEHIGYPPENLSDLPESLPMLLKEVGEYALHQQGYNLSKFCSALEKNGEDILADTESADWLYETEGHGESLKKNTHIADPIGRIFELAFRKKHYSYTISCFYIIYMLIY